MATLASSVRNINICIEPTHIFLLPERLVFFTTGFQVVPTVCAIFLAP